MKIHDLKVAGGFFDDIHTGRKRFEVRRNDRDFRVGDVLYLREWCDVLGYSGRACAACVTYLLEGWHDLPEGVVVMSLGPVWDVPGGAP